MLLGDHRAADPAALQAAAVDERTRRRALGGVAEDAPRAGDPERLVRLAPAPDLVETGPDRGRVIRDEMERGGHDDLRRPVRRGVLEAALAIGKPERARGHAHLGPVRPEDEGGLEDRRDVRLVGPGIRPHGAAHVSGDREPELESGEARVSRDGRRLRHREPGVRDEAAVGDLIALRADVDEQPAHAGVGDHHVAAAAQERDRHLAPTGQPDQAAQLERVDRRRIEVRRAADAHRREARQRFVAGGPDAQAALDLRSDPDRVERHAHRPRSASPGDRPGPAPETPSGPAPTAARRAISAAGG